VVRIETANSLLSSSLGCRCLTEISAISLSTCRDRAIMVLESGGMCCVDSAVLELNAKGGSLRDSSPGSLIVELLVEMYINS